MFIFFGTRLFGRVDQAADQFHVATQFFHIYCFPLIPLRSYLFIEGTLSNPTEQCLQIPMSWKSVLVAYLRGVLAWAAIINLVWVFITLPFITGGPGLDILDCTFKTGIGVFCAIAFWATYQFFHANEQKTQMWHQYLGNH